LSAAQATLELKGKREQPMKLTFIEHLRGEWPLVLVAVGMLIYIPVVLVRGVFYTNQGNVLREVDPEGYWRWIRRFLVLLLVCLTVIFGSYYLALH
jgi:Mn2+/Fe2+ NRAMP family transporter